MPPLRKKKKRTMKDQKKKEIPLKKFSKMSLYEHRK
jgi:hypothetical protein